MNSKKYIDEHDFGYGREENIKKINLRNFSDLEYYVESIIKILFNAEVNKNLIKFYGDLDEYKVFVRVI